ANTPPALLAKHLAFLTTHYHLVPLDSVLRDAREGALAITFDDAYRSVYDNAFPILRQHRCTATVFVVTDAIDHDRLIWVNELTWLLNMGGDSARHLAARLVGAKSDSTIAVIVDHARALQARGDCRDLLD